MMSTGRLRVTSIVLGIATLGHLSLLYVSWPQQLLRIQLCGFCGPDKKVGIRIERSDAWTREDCALFNGRRPLVKRGKAFLGGIPYVRRVSGPFVARNLLDRGNRRFIANLLQGAEDYKRELFVAASDSGNER